MTYSFLNMMLAVTPAAAVPATLKLDMTSVNGQAYT